MKTEDLIEALAVGLEPARPSRLNPLMLAGAAAVAGVAVAMLLGVRGDIADAVTGPVFWLKAAYTGALALAAGWLATQLGRPGTNVGPAWRAVAGVAAVAVLAGAVELARSPPQARLDDWLGFTWTICARNILMVSALTGPLVFLSARSLAPTRPGQAGAAIGLLSGAIAATAYGLHCPEATAAFVATWYTLGMAAAAAIGALVGRFALRW